MARRERRAPVSIPVIRHRRDASLVAAPMLHSSGNKPVFLYMIIFSRIWQSIKFLVGGDSMRTTCVCMWRSQSCPVLSLCPRTHSITTPLLKWRLFGFREAKAGCFLTASILQEFLLPPFLSCGRRWVWGDPWPTGDNKPGWQTMRFIDLATKVWI